MTTSESNPGDSPKLRVGLVQDPMPTPSQIGLRSAFERRFELSYFAGHDPAAARRLAATRELDAIVWHVDDAWLATVDELEWGDFSGARIQFEEDAIQDFSTIAGRKRRPPLAKRNFHAGRFDLLAVTGKRVAEMLMDDGVPAVWIPKAYDSDLIRDERRPERSGICTYGTGYPARRAALRAISSRGFAIDRVSCPPAELSTTLNSYAACFVCNMELLGSGFIPGRLLRRVPRTFQIPRVGLEPMIKNFEAAAAGCVPVCDAISELEDLGFVDGLTMIAYSTFRELLEKVEHYRDRTGELIGMGAAASELATARHSWDARAGEFETLIIGGFGGGRHRR